MGFNSGFKGLKSIMLDNDTPLTFFFGLSVHFNQNAACVNHKGNKPQEYPNIRRHKNCVLFSPIKKKTIEI